MCRETQLEWHSGGADLDDTLVSLQPRTTVKDVGEVLRSPEPPNVLGVREQANARNPSHLPTARVSAYSGLVSTKPAAPNPSFAPASRAVSRNQLSEKYLKATAANASSKATAPRTAPRNPSPTPASRATARSSSPTPAPRTSSTRNPSPSPASRPNPVVPSTKSPLTPSSIGKTVPSLRRPASPALARKEPSRPLYDDNGRRIVTPDSARKSAAPGSAPASALDSSGELSPRSALDVNRALRMSINRSRPVYDDNGRKIVTPDSARKSATIGSSPSIVTPDSARKSAAITSSSSSSLDSSGELSPRSALDVNRALRMSINRSLKKEGLGQWSLEPLAFSPIKKLTPLELQAQKKERISGYGRKGGGHKSGQVACEGTLDSSLLKPETRKRCHWVTPQSEPGLITYHDDVWGVPVHDDKLLFELLVLEGLQGELSRPQILSMRDYFRAVFAGFDPEIVAKFDEKKVAALKVDEIIRQPEAKLRGVIDNAKQLLKIIREFGSFDKYLWNFVGFKPIVNNYHIFTQIPVKSSKSETLSKDLMRRGFRYVGPTTVYSFMQAAGVVNDHLVSCYRHGECSI